MRGTPLRRSWARYRDALSEVRTFVQAGIPIRDGLASAAKRSRNAALLTHLLRRIEAGDSLAEALEGISPPASPVHVAMVDAGERSGRLAEALGLILEDLERRAEARRRFTAQTAYPVAVLFLAFLLPPIHWLLAGDLLSYLQSVAPFLLLAALVAVAILARARWTRALAPLRNRLESTCLVVPLVRNWVLEAQWSRGFRLLGLLLESGLSFAESLPIAARGVSWLSVRRELLHVGEELDQGRSVSEAFGRIPTLPALAVDRIATAETSGTLPAGFREIAEDLEKRSRWRVDILLRILPIGVYLVVALVILSQALKVFRV